MRGSASKRTGTHALGWVLLVMLGVGTIELIAFVALNYILPKGKAGFLLYSPPTKPTQDEFERYLKIRNPLLGWPTEEALEAKKIDSTGSRPTPSYPVPGNECISLYGDSYVYGNEVTDEEAWGNLLSSMKKCRVANYGYSAYGTDQALLRFLSMKHDETPMSILGIFMTNFKRNVNQYRYYFDGRDSSRFLFKPRFLLLPAGELQLIPLPEVTYEQYDQFVKRPGHFLNNEFFIPGSTYGPTPLEFPFTQSMMSVIMKPEIKNWIIGKPDWSDFVEPGHSSKAMELMVALTAQFMKECKHRNKSCFAVIFPSRSGYEYYVKTRKLPVELFLHALEQRKIPYLHLTRKLKERLQDRRICAILARPNTCSGHFGPEGNRLIAEILFDHLQQTISLQQGVLEQDVGSRIVND